MAIRSGRDESLVEDLAPAHEPLRRFTREHCMRITVVLKAGQQDVLDQLLAACNRSEFSSHGRLTLATLLEMLLEDAALVVTRPGSWEGANMAQVLQSHGYLLP